MQKKTLLLILLFIQASVFGQNIYQSQEIWPEQNQDAEFLTVKGERHGKSYFTKHRFPEVEYEASETLTFDKYHTPDVMYAWYKKWAEMYPDIVNVYEVGKSFEGRSILQMTVTNKATGKATDKPAAYFEGGRHSGEITSSESILWLTQHLLENYGKDDEITHLIDTKVVYLRPQNNPDGATLYLYTAQRNRSTVRPHDNDRDGLLDEDSEEDLDGDGIIYQMRKKAVTEEEKEKANYIIHPEDAKGRLMKRVFEGEGDYLLYSEGIDNDGDGRYNEDGIGGLDLHRNYPENWRPDVGGDLTGRGYTQYGAGAFPLSEPETRSAVLFVLANPNISVVNSMDTRVPMHLRPPSTSKGEESMFPKDLALYEQMDSLGLSFTDYPWAGDVYETYATRYKVNRMTGDPLKPSPLFGHGPDFGYFYYGSIWYGDELWNNGAMKDYNNDGVYDDLDAIRWDDEDNGSRGFKPWTAFEDPVLGTVEIGGFHPKFFGQNGPPWQLENWAKKQALFNLAMAKRLPELNWLGHSITKREDNVYELRVRWRNDGLLPVALEQAKLVKIVKEDRLVLSFEDGLEKDDKVEVVSPETYDKTIYAGYTDVGETKEAVFLVKINTSETVKATLKLLSTRGGYLEMDIDFQQGDK